MYRHAKKSIKRRMTGRVECKDLSQIVLCVGQDVDGSPASHARGGKPPGTRNILVGTSYPIILLHRVQRL